MSDKKIQDEIDANLEVFRREKPNLLAENHGKYALLRHQEFAGFYDTIQDAVTAGDSAYNDGLFSVQLVTETPVDLGFYSHAMRVADA